MNQLDFSAENIATVIATGDRAAVSLKGDRGLPRCRTRRAGVVPPIASAMTQKGTDPDMARVLRVTIGPLDGRATDVPELQRRLQKPSQVERYREIWLHPAQGPGDSVLFAAEGSASSVERQLAGAAFDRALVAGGALQRDNYGLFRNARGYFGASAGFGMTTALGPVVIEFGGNDHGRDNVWFRFGDWF